MNWEPSGFPFSFHHLSPNEMKQLEQIETAETQRGSRDMHDMKVCFCHDKWYNICNYISHSTRM